MNYYVLGFAFLFKGAQVLLMKKARPDWQKGKVNGIGGKIEPGEKSVNAMVREFKEETGVVTKPEDWRMFATLNGKDHIVTCYTSQLSSVAWHTTDPSEPVFSCAPEEIFKYNVIPNLHYLIPLAKDKTIVPVLILDLEKI